MEQNRIDYIITVERDYEFPSNKSRVYINYIEEKSFIADGDIESITKKLKKWVEHDYDGNFLPYNLAFPLLKELRDQEVPFERKDLFQEEIKKAFVNGTDSIKIYLIEERYLMYLSMNEMEDIIGDLMPKLFREYLHDLGINEYLSKKSMLFIKRHMDLFEDFGFVKELLLELKKSRSYYDRHALRMLTPFLSSEIINELCQWVLEIEINEFKKLISLGILELFDNNQLGDIFRDFNIFIRLISSDGSLGSLVRLNRISSILRDDVRNRFFKWFIKKEYYDLHGLIQAGFLCCLNKKQRTFILELEKKKLRDVEENWKKSLSLQFK
ncbi:hypothetical protein LCGC14_2473090 [marine sediment metagenome]|uniref:Uncharacterized protein n=1 Tax=marine sediment metagenome TaxID=412755 RepID=A0A0F9DLW4_9ZZZZ